MCGPVRSTHRGGLDCRRRLNHGLSRQSINSLLPPHRDDEPASLRQDILDELQRSPGLLSTSAKRCVDWIQTCHVNMFWNDSAIRRPSLCRLWLLMR